MRMRWIVLFGHLGLFVSAVAGLIFWYEVERVFYCRPIPAAGCGIFSFGLSPGLLIEIYGIALAVVALPRLAIWLAKSGNAPKGHAVYLLKTVPTAIFTLAVLFLTQGRAGANDVEWISLTAAALLLILSLRGLLAYGKGWELRSGTGWIFAIIGLLILAMMAAVTLLALRNMDRFF